MVGQIEPDPEHDRENREADVRLRERELEIKAAEQSSQAAEREAGIRLRERELEVKAAEQASEATEVQARIEELRRSRWTSPLFLALLAAAVAAAGNVAVAVFNGAAQRKVEEAKNRAEIELEDKKNESARILEMIKTDQPDKAAVNLEFLLETGLISNEKLTENLKRYLAERKPGQGPSLPAPYIAQSPSSYLGQVVASGDSTALCTTVAPEISLWHRGVQVKGDKSIKPGTVIATFDPDGTYGNHKDGRSHCAIYLAQTESGILVVDQWTNHPAGLRLIHFRQGSSTPNNDGDQFFVVQ